MTTLKTNTRQILTTAQAREIARATGRDFPAGDWLDESAPIDQRFDVLAVIVAAFAALAVAVYLA